MSEKTEALSDLHAQALELEITRQDILTAYETRQTPQQQNVEVTGEATPEQLAEWDAAHGTKGYYKVIIPADLGQLNTDLGVVYLLEPDMDIYRKFRALLADGKEELETLEALLTDCWLGGDERVKKMPRMFMPAALAAAQRIAPSVAALKKN